MFEPKKIFQFLLYWVLTLFYGTIALAYLFLHTLRNRSSQESENFKSKEAQPHCLSDPELGRHRYFKRDGTKLHFVELGDPSNPLVILIHGSPGFWFCWRKQISYLAQYSWVVAVDLRGCGDSDTHLYRNKYKPEEIIKDICYLLKLLDRSSATVICNEISSQIGWIMADRFPHLVSKLVLINGPHPEVIRSVFNHGWKFYLKLKYLMLLQIPLLPEMLISKKIYSFFDPFPSLRDKGSATTGSEVEAYKYTFSRKEDWIGSLHMLRQLGIRPKIMPTDPFSIKCDTLLLMSSCHPRFPSEFAYRSAEYAERIKIRIIDGGGENIQVSHHEMVNKELDNFLERPRYIAPRTPTARNSLVNRVFGAVKTPYSMIPTSDYFLEKLGAQAVS